MSEKIFDGKRIRSRRLELNIQVKDLAKLLTVTPQTVTNWELHGREVYEKYYSLLAKALNTTEAYLLGETEDPKPPQQFEGGSRPPSVPSPVPGGTTAEALKQPVMFEIPKLKRGEFITIGGIVYQGVPVISWASAGTATNYCDLDTFIDETIVSPTKDKNAVAIVVEGESMVPVFEPGDIVVVEPNSIPRPKDFVVARLLEDGGVLCKQIVKTGQDGSNVELHSINEKFPDIVKPIFDFRFIYPIVSSTRKHRK